MEGNPVSLEVEIVGNSMLDAESTLLEVVIGNLVRNAFSYTKSGKVKIRLESNRFIVSDTGIGIHDDELNKIFLPHYRGETSSGAGVGLSLVKRICDRYHWRIKFLSQKTQGTTAEVVFFDESI
jgi:signal transduction histidine kinase